MHKFLFIDKKKASTKVVAMVLFALILLMGYYVLFSYYDYQEQTLSKLNAISKTLSLQINGDEHEALLKNYKKIGDIKTNDQDSIYLKIHQILLKAYNANDLKSEIATLYLDKNTNKFSYVVNSTAKPYFRDPYKQFQKTFFENYTTGGKIEAYTDEFGTWLTAFSPITNKAGKVVGIVEVDELYKDFLLIVDKKLYTHIGIFILIFFIVGFILLHFVRKVIKNEEVIKDKLVSSNIIIKERDEDILNSIIYAKKIQNAMLPSLDVIRQNIPNSLVFFQPKDIVSGDFYFFYEIENKNIFFIAACDCTGHGVPGALLSMIGNNLLNQFIQSNPNITPADLLNQLNNGVIDTLKQEAVLSETKDGMDIALCYVDRSKNTIIFAGANRPLFIVRNNSVIEYKGDKHAIGGYNHTTSKYTNQVIFFEKKDRFYLFSDGFTDQFGSATGKKFLLKNFRQLLLETSRVDFNTQQHLISNEYFRWKGNTEQTDDVLVIGFELD